MKWGRTKTFLKSSLLAAQFAAALVLACLPLGQIPTFAGPCGKLLCLCESRMHAVAPDGKVAPVPVTLKLNDDPFSNSGDFAVASTLHLESPARSVPAVATLEAASEQKAEFAAFAVITAPGSFHAPPPKI